MVERVKQFIPVNHLLSECHHGKEGRKDGTYVFDNTTMYNAYTVVPATSGYLRFGAKVALRGRWPLVGGNRNS